MGNKRSSKTDKLPSSVSHTGTPKTDLPTTQSSEVIKFKCMCGKQIVVPSHAAGRKGRCPICGKILVVPIKSADQADQITTFQGVEEPKVSSDELPRTNKKKIPLANILRIAIGVLLCLFGLVSFMQIRSMSPYMNFEEALITIIKDPQSKVIRPEQYDIFLLVSIFISFLGASQIIAPAWNYVIYRISPRAKRRSVIEKILIWIFAVLVMAWVSAMTVKHFFSEEERNNDMSLGISESQLARESSQNRQEQIIHEEERVRQEQARIQQQSELIGAPIPTTPQHFEVKWRFRTGGPIHSEPVIVDNTVYIASTDSIVYALNLSTGEFLWSYITEVGKTSTRAQRKAELELLYKKSIFDNNEDSKNMQLSYEIKLAADQNTVYLTQGSRIYAIDALKGKEFWVKEILPPLQPMNASDFTEVISRIPRMPFAGILSRPAICLGTIFVTMNGDLYAIDAAKNEILWTYPCDKSDGVMNRGSTFFYWTEPVVVGDVVYFAAGRKFYVIKSTTGQPRIIFDLPNSGVFDVFLAAHEQTAFVCEIVKQQSNGANTSSYGEKRMLEAVNVNTQKVSWSYPYDLPTSIIGECAYCMDANGTVLTIDALTGRNISTNHSGLGVTGSVTIGADLIYFGTGQLIKDNRIGLMQNPQGANYSIGSPHGILCAMDQNKDQIRALTLFPNLSINTSLAVAGKHVIFGSEDSYVYCVEVHEGSKSFGQIQQDTPSESLEQEASLVPDDQRAQRLADMRQQVWRVWPYPRQLWRYSGSLPERGNVLALSGNHLYTGGRWIARWNDETEQWTEWRDIVPQAVSVNPPTAMAASDDELWCAWRGGYIAHLIVSNDLWLHYNLQEILPLTDISKEVLNFVIDDIILDNEHVWFLTGEEIVEFDREKEMWAIHQIGNTTQSAPTHNEKNHDTNNAWSKIEGRVISACANDNELWIATNPIPEKSYELPDPNGRRVFVYDTTSGTVRHVTELADYSVQKLWAHDGKMLFLGQEVFGQYDSGSNSVTEIWKTAFFSSGESQKWQIIHIDPESATLWAAPRPGTGMGVSASRGIFCHNLPSGMYVSYNSDNSPFPGGTTYEKVWDVEAGEKATWIWAETGLVRFAHHSRPRVIQTTPQDQMSNVAKDTPIIFVMDEDIREETIDQDCIVLLQDGKINIPGIGHYEMENRTFKFEVPGGLARGKQYQAILSPGFCNLYDQPMWEEYTITFTTSN